MLSLRALHHVHLQVADLDANDRFVRSFGLIEVAREAERHYYRGVGTDAYSYVVEAGDHTRLLGLAFLVDAPEDLQRATQIEGAGPVHDLAGPGGGQGVTLLDPEGLRIELVHGVTEREAEPLRPPLETNHPADRRRLNAEPKYPEPGPAKLLRIGHVGLYVKDYGRCEAWYRDTLGLVPSDRLYAGSPDNVIGGFYRINRGEEYVDHHTLAMFGFGKTEVHHLSFEVADLEQQFFAHRHLLKEGWQSVWGVGRHPKGSHVFDVWKDPNGLRFETFTDTDLVNVHRAADNFPVETMVMDLWSDESYHKYFA